jgi:phospholipid/cholesterol/gamma-HCH transport system substrate-binding protein
MASKNNTFVLGLIVFAALLIFFGSILLLSGRNILLGRYYRIYFEFPDIVGLRNQAPVAMRGYQVGWVKDVMFLKNRVRIAVDIKKKFKIPADSQVEIISLNFIGEKAVSIKPGVSSEFLQRGALIRGENKDLMTLATNILHTAKEKIERGEIDKVIQKAKDSVDAVLGLVRTVNSQVEKLDIAQFNRQVEEVGRAGRELRNFAAEAQASAEKFSSKSGQSLDKFNETLGNVDAALQQLTDLSEEIKKLTSGIDRGDVFGNLNQTVQELRTLLADIKKNPKKYVKFSIF